MITSPHEVTFPRTPFSSTSKIFPIKARLCWNAASQQWVCRLWHTQEWKADGVSTSGGYDSQKQGGFLPAVRMLWVWGLGTPRRENWNTVTQPLMREIVLRNASLHKFVIVWLWKHVLTQTWMVQPTAHLCYVVRPSDLQPFSSGGTHRLMTKILWHTKKKFFFLPTWQENSYDFDSAHRTAMVLAVVTF